MKEEPYPTGIMNKSTFHETKEVVSRLREPYKIKIKHYRYETKEKLVDGHIIELELNVSAESIDNMKNPEKEIMQSISNAIWLIENPMKSRYLGTK